MSYDTRGSGVTKCLFCNNSTGLVVWKSCSAGGCGCKEPVKASVEVEEAQKLRDFVPGYLSWMKVSRRMADARVDIGSNNAAVFAATRKRKRP